MIGPIMPPDNPDLMTGYEALGKLSGVRLGDFDVEYSPHELSIDDLARIYGNRRLSVRSERNANSIGQFLKLMALADGSTRCHWVTMNFHDGFAKVLVDGGNRYVAHFFMEQS